VASRSHNGQLVLLTWAGIRNRPSTETKFPSFAGLFGAAPSIALVTLLITLSQKGAPFAAIEGRSMIGGAFALAPYSWTVCVVLKEFLLSSPTAAMATPVVWFAVALGVSAALFQLL
jgi:hypothetical protein